MDSAHRGILRRYREKVVDDLDTDLVKETLIAKGIFDSEQWECIAKAGNATRHDKASALMDELPRRGPDAFWYFCEALMVRRYGFLGEQLIKEATQLSQKLPTRILALSLSGQIKDIKQKHQEMLQERGPSVMKALKKVCHAKKTGGRKESEQRVTSLKQIKEALKSHLHRKRHQDQKESLFDDSDELALTDILKIVKTLKRIRKELQNDGTVSGFAAEMKTMLVDEAGFPTLYEMTVDRGSDYLKDLRMQGVGDSDIKKYGFVLVLIPHLCHLSEQAVKVMRQRPLPKMENPRAKDEVQPPSDEDEDHDHDEQEEDPLAESGYMENDEQREHEETSGGQEEERITLKDLSDQVENIGRKFDQKFDSLSQKLDQQNEDIKGSLLDVSRHLNDIKQALGGQTEMMTKVSELEKRVRNLLIQEIDRTTIKGKIKDIESEVVDLKKKFQGGDKEIQAGLAQMNDHLHDMLMKLERDSMEQQQLSAAIDLVKNELEFRHFEDLALELGFNHDEIIQIRSTTPDKSDIKQQKSELLQRWSKRRGCTAKSLALACRNIGLSTLADNIIGILGASSGAPGPLGPIRARASIVRETWTGDSKGATGAKPKK